MNPIGECPVCGKPATPKQRPFCSARCGHVDLKKWLGGEYVMPGVEEADPDEMLEHLAHLPPPVSH